MLNKVNINKFLDYEYKPTDRKQCISKVICIWLLNIFFYFVGTNSIYTGIFVSVMNIPISMLLLKFICKFDNIDYKLLFNSVFNIYLSCLLILLSYKVIYANNIIILICCFLAFFIFIIILWIIVFLIVNSGKYRYKNTEKKKTGSYIGALFGFLLTRFIFEDLELTQEDLQILIFFILLVATIILNCSNFDLLKIVLKKNRSIRKTEDDSKTGDSSLS